MLTPFSPLDITYKKLNVKNLWKCIFRVSWTMSFSYLSKFALNVCMSGRVGRETDPLYTFYNFCCGSCYNIQFKPYAISKMELFVTKNS